MIIPAVWKSETFSGQLGSDKENQMWTFDDKGGRPCCLVPEATRLLEEMWLSDWSKREKSLKCFYIARCYRYDRPQKGRYREFTQIGVEWFGKGVDMSALKRTAKNLLEIFSDNFVFKDDVERGMSYYEEGLGFEIEAPWLGAQKQVLGGGKFPSGAGFALGLERLCLALSEETA